jgi:hypothetical protein
MTTETKYGVMLNRVRLQPPQQREIICRRRYPMETYAKRRLRRLRDRTVFLLTECPGLFRVFYISLLDINYHFVTFIAMENPNKDLHIAIIGAGKYPVTS